MSQSTDPKELPFTEPAEEPPQTPGPCSPFEPDEAPYRIADPQVPSCPTECPSDLQA